MCEKECIMKTHCVTTQICRVNTVNIVQVMLNYTIIFKIVSRNRLEIERKRRETETERKEREWRKNRECDTNIRDGEICKRETCERSKGNDRGNTLSIAITIKNVSHDSNIWRRYR